MTCKTADEAKAYLTSANIPFSEVTELSGGGANYTFRITASDGTTTVIKHAEPLLKYSGYPLSVERMEYEAMALRNVPALIAQPSEPHGGSTDVAPAHLLNYDPEAHVLHLRDGGPTTLKQAYMTDTNLDVITLGKNIATWLARLHLATTSASGHSSPEAKAAVGDSPISRTIYRYSYANLPSAQRKFGFDPSIGERINELYGSKLQTDDVCLCHGDFWPGNMLLDSSGREGGVPAVTIVDWEIVRIGNGATDVGQFAAEAWLLDRFHGSKGFVKAFLSAYLAARPLSESDWTRVVVQFAVHIAYWTTVVSWGSEDETRELVKIGTGICERVLKGDVGWVAGEVFGL